MHISLLEWWIFFRLVQSWYYLSKKQNSIIISIHRILDNRVHHRAKPLTSGVAAGAATSNVVNSGSGPGPAPAPTPACSTTESSTKPTNTSPTNPSLPSTSSTTKSLTNQNSVNQNEVKQVSFCFINFNCSHFLSSVYFFFYPSSHRCARVYM